MGTNQCYSFGSKKLENKECPHCKKIFFIRQKLNDLIFSHTRSCEHFIENPEYSYPRTDPDFLSRISLTKYYFNKIREDWRNGSIFLSINRENLLIDSLIQINMLSSQQLRSEFNIYFIGENSQDAGGLTKEWIYLLIQEIFKPEANLFKLTNSSSKNYKFLRGNQDYELYKFVGMIIGKALFEGIPLNYGFSSVIYKVILGYDISIEDLKELDIDLYNSLVFMKNESIETLIFENFTVLNDLGEIDELVESGTHIEVNNDNKDLYVEERIAYETQKSFRQSLSAMVEGIGKVFPVWYLKHLLPQDLIYFINGETTLDLIEWEKNAEFKGIYSKSHYCIRWFWEIVNELSHEKRSDLLYFVTGSKNLGIEGFQGLTTIRGEPAQFCVHSSTYYQGCLPRAHTCFNRLYLPVYESKAEMKESIEKVLEHYLYGFGLE